MESSEIKNRTDKLKDEINKLLSDYVTATDLVPEAFQGIADPKTGRYEITLGIRL